MKTWRPENWKANPCDTCPDKREDEWGLECDLYCGMYSAYINYEAGANAILEALDANTLEMEIQIAITGMPTGKWVFIPEEE